MADDEPPEDGLSAVGNHASTVGPANRPTKKDRALKAAAWILAFLFGGFLANFFLNAVNTSADRAEHCYHSIQEFRDELPTVVLAIIGANSQGNPLNQDGTEWVNFRKKRNDLIFNCPMRQPSYLNQNDVDMALSGYSNLAKRTTYWTDQGKDWRSAPEATVTRRDMEPHLLRMMDASTDFHRQSLIGQSWRLIQMKGVDMFNGAIHPDD